MTLLFAFLIGLFAGLRSLTPPAAVAWAVHLGWLKLARPLSLIGSLPAVIILSLLALTELILDKLPNTPNRTAPLGLIARIVTGGLTGACVSLGADRSFPRGRHHCEVSFRRRRSLSLINSFKSATGRISIGPHFMPGCCDMS